MSSVPSSCIGTVMLTFQVNHLDEISMGNKTQHGAWPMAGAQEMIAIYKD